MGPDGRAFDDFTATRNNVFDNVLSAAKAIKPMEYGGRRLELTDVDYDPADVDDESDKFSYGAQSRAIREKQTMGRRLRGTFLMTDLATGEQQAEQRLLAVVPRVNEDGTMLYRGSRYAFVNQQRLKPASYGRVKKNQELEVFNAVKQGTGPTHRYVFDPDRSVFYFSLGNSRIPLAGVLKTLGATDDDLKAAWGEEIAAKNIKADNGKNLQKVFEHLGSREAIKTALSDEDKRNAIRETFAKMEVDPWVLKRNLGIESDRLTPEVILASTRKILDMGRGDQEGDDRDSLQNQKIHSVEDFLAERISMDSGREQKNNFRKALAMNKLSAVGHKLLQKQLEDSVFGSGLAILPENPNPLSAWSTTSRITKLGEGGVGSTDAIPKESRDYNASHAGYFDPAVTVESSRIGVDLNVGSRTIKGKDGRIYTPLINARTGQTEYVAAEDMADKVLAPDKETDIPGHYSAIRNGSEDYYSKDEIDYFLPDKETAFAGISNLVPLKMMQPHNRTAMGQRFLSQAVPLLNREAPLVRSAVPGSNSGLSFESLYRDRVGVVSAKVGGVVKDVRPDRIVVQSQGSDGKPVLKTHWLHEHTSLGAKTAMMNKPVVQVGQEVAPDDVLATSNFSDDKGDIAMGINAKMALMPWGDNYEDAYTISESFAKRTASHQSYDHRREFNPDALIHKTKFMSALPSAYNKEQLEKLDDHGVVQVGQVLKNGDPVMLSAVRKAVNLAKPLTRSGHRAYQDQSQVWDHENDGTVTAVHRDARGNVHVSVDTHSPTIDADKFCYSWDTEVLTSVGWVRIDELTVEHEVATLIDGARFDYVHPLQVQSYRHVGRMYSVSSTQVDLCVTDNHKLYAKPRCKGKLEDLGVDNANCVGGYGLYTSASLYGKEYRLKRDGDWGGADPAGVLLEEEVYDCGERELTSGVQRSFKTAEAKVIPLQAFAGILGAYLAEGSLVWNEHSGTYAIVISQLKEPNRVAFAAFLDHHGVKYSLNKSGFMLYGKQWFQWFGELRQWSKKKFIPEYVFNWTKETQRVLFDWMFWGDGSESATALHYFTSSEKLADDVQRLALHVGYSATIKPPRPGGEHVIKGVKTFCQPGYVVSILRKKNSPTINHSHVKKQRAQFEGWINYDGEVYCPSMPYGNVVYVRRNGKPVWCGNSELFGTKGVVKVIPDDQMIHDEDGKPFDVVSSDLGLISRKNSSRAVAMWLGKVAQKTGNPIFVDEDDNSEEIMDKAYRLMKEHGVSPTETVIDPKTGRRISGVATGPQFMMKLTHQAESKANARALGAYDANGQPAKGADDGMQAKRVSNQELGALMAHGSMSYLQEIGTVKGSKNEEWAARFMAGKDLPAVEVPMAYNKFLSYVKGMGVNPVRTGSVTRLWLMNNGDIDQLSGGRQVREADTVNLAKDLKPISGGLFDPAIFGDDGKKFAMYQLATPIPHPSMEKPLLKVMNITGKQFRGVLSGKEELGEYGTGVQAISKFLENLDIGKEKAKAIHKIRTGARTAKDAAIQQYRYLSAIEKHGLKPSELIIDKVPILPPIYRPISKLAGKDTPLIDGLNHLYQQMIYADQNQREIGKYADDDSEERLATYDAVQAAMGLQEPADKELRQKNVKGIMKKLVGPNPKNSFVQGKLLSHTVDSVGRGVALPNAQLKLNEIGIPEEQAWKIFEMPMMRQLTRRGISVTEAKDAIEQRKPVARDALEREMSYRPVTASRAPVLHKFGIMGFMPKLVEGYSLQFNPLVHPAYNLDHDGDQRHCKVLIAIKIIGEDEKSKEKALENFPLQVRLSGISLLSVQTQEKLMASFTRASLPVLRGYSVLPIDLADFPRLDRSNVSKGRCGDIHWYKVPEDIRVLALNRETGQPEWAEVSRWTVHHGCEVEIVTLANGVCIFTDDDPRGVLGVVPGESLKVVTATPSDAKARGMLVPRAVHYGGVEETAEVMDIPQFYNSDIESERVHKLASAIDLDIGFGWFIGAHVADGWTAFSNGVAKEVCFAKSHIPTREKWQKEVARFLTKEPHFGSRVRDKADAVESGSAFGGTSASVLTASCLGRLFVDMLGHGAGNKHLPDFATCGPKAFRVAIIAGLLDTDATVCYHKTKNKRNPQLQVWYNTTSLRLARDVVLVAASVGIQAKVRWSKMTTAGNDAWEVTLRPGDVQDLITEYPQLMVNEDRRKLILEAVIDRESGAYQRLSRVPTTPTLAKLLRLKLGVPKDPTRADKSQRSLYSALSEAIKLGYMSQVTAKLTATLIGDDYIRSLPNGDLFILYRDNDSITWEYIESVEKTGKVEVGYDLTIPGYENWMDTSGVFGPNTMNFHAVITDEAVKEVKEKMLPTSMLFSPADFESPMFVPRQDHGLGLYLASTAKEDRRPVSFVTMKDAFEAFQRGEINVNTPIRVLKK